MFIKNNIYFMQNIADRLCQKQFNYYYEVD